MADWNKPIIDDLKVDVLDMLKARDFDSVTLAENPTNPPIGFVRWSTVDKCLQRWTGVGTGWQNMVLSLAGGGTGASSGTGFGTMAYQNSDNVSITKGTITGLTDFRVAGNSLFSGIISSGPSSIALTNSAGFIREEAIADTDIFCRRAQNETITGTWSFGDTIHNGGVNANANIYMSSQYPALWMRSNVAPANAQYWRTLVDGSGTWLIDAYDNAWNQATNAFYLSRSAHVVTNMVINCPLTVVNEYAFKNFGTFEKSLRITGDGNNSIIGNMVWGLQITGAAGALVSGKIIWGDGTGWQLQFCKSTGGSSSIAVTTFTDTGQIVGTGPWQTSGLSISIATQGSGHGAGIHINNTVTSAAPTFLLSEHPGVSYVGTLLCNNYLPRGAGDERVNRTTGGSFLKMLTEEINFYSVDNLGNVRKSAMIGGASGTVFSRFYDRMYFFTPSDEQCGQIYAEGGLNPRISVMGTTWGTFGASGQFLQFRSEVSMAYYVGANPAPFTDTGLNLGGSGNRWWQVYSYNGVITGSDIRLKNRHGKISKSRNLIKLLDAEIFSHDDHTLDTGEIVPSFKFPGFSAQEVDSKLDKTLGTQIVDKSNPDAWGMNYSHLIPIMWQALKELLEDYDNR